MARARDKLVGFNLCDSVLLFFRFGLVGSFVLFYRSLLFRTKYWQQIFPRRPLVLLLRWLGRRPLASSGCGGSQI